MPSWVKSKWWAVGMEKRLHCYKQIDNGPWDPLPWAHSRPGILSHSYRVLLTVTAFTVQAVHIWTVPCTTSPTQWTWVWINSGSWWWTGRPGVLQSMESQRVGQDWVAELNWTYTTLHTLQCATQWKASHTPLTNMSGIYTLSFASLIM